MKTGLTDMHDNLFVGHVSFKSSLVACAACFAVLRDRRDRDSASNAVAGWNLYSTAQMDAFGKFRGVHLVREDRQRDCREREIVGDGGRRNEDCDLF